MSRARMMAWLVGGPALAAGFGVAALWAAAASGASNGQQIRLANVAPSAAGIRIYGQNQHGGWVSKYLPAPGRAAPHTVTGWWWRGRLTVSERLSSGQLLQGTCRVPGRGANVTRCAPRFRAVPPKPPWVGTWATADVPAPAHVPPRHTASAETRLAATGFHDRTLREIVHTSVGGSHIRIRLSNLYGTRPLTINDVHVAVRRRGAAIVPGTDRRVTFGDSPSVTIPAGQRVFSDSVPLAVHAQQDVAVSVYLAGPTGPATWHPLALTTSYYSPHGDHANDPTGGAFTAPTSGQIKSWYFLDGVDVQNYGGVGGAVVTFGPSTTDGLMSTFNANRRYPDDLARLLLREPAGQRMSVLNAGISGNRLLTAADTQGVSGVKRFVTDAIQQSGVRAVIIWEGTNDIGADPGINPGQITSAYRTLITAAHHAGIKVIGATLQPTDSPGRRNHVRLAVNQWIKTSGGFDGVADYDKALRDPHNPLMMKQTLTSPGQHTHPNDEGYQVVAGVADRALIGALGLAPPA